MNKVDIIRKHIGNDDFYDMNGTSMLSNILNAMEEYKEQEVKNCSIPDVVLPKGTLCPCCGENESIEDWQTYFRCKLCDTKF